MSTFFDCLKELNQDGYTNVDAIYILYRKFLDVWR